MQTTYAGSNDIYDVSFMPTRAISVVILLLIAIALYLSFRPRPWATEEAQDQ